jgi:hypothetical protein
MEDQTLIRVPSFCRSELSYMEASVFGWLPIPYSVGVCLGDTGFEPVTSTV